MKTEAGKPTQSKINVGILALQGSFSLHSEILSRVAFDLQIEDFKISLVKRPDQLESLDGIILPGGESTVVSKLLVSSGLDKELGNLLENGFPAFGTCAGLIILSNHFNVLDCVVKRNAYGTQIDSFESEIEFLPAQIKCDAFFIRAPKIESVGEKSDVIATHNSDIVGVSQGNVMGITFHPEVAGSTDIHQFFVENIIRRVSSLKV